MAIEIPKRLSNHLLKDDAWYTCVTSAKNKIEALISGSPVFFPDYTGHGVSHINAVLAAADRLILDRALEDGDKDESSGILEPSDVGYLICAILIHDLGMFLKEDGFRKLIAGACGKPITSSGDASWKTAWREYIDSTQRSSREAMSRQFGKYIPTSAGLNSMENIGEGEKRIIGEFLRRNHGRLAHEIVLNSLPGSTSIDIFEGSHLDKNDRDMIGLLARSHTVAIRDTEAYLKTKFEEGPLPENIPVFFLMSVLRIADLLDAGAHRAPSLLLAQQNIHVPVSADEWKWNQRIDLKKCRWMLKQKNRYIYANPQSSIEFVMLDRWLRWVQSELDLCWSILSEYHPDGYRLSIHRVTSRIQQPDVLKTMRKSFLPREVTISANPEITRLLIEPLYGSDPSYGIRELLQNAVDACAERTQRESDPAYKGLVTIRIDPWTDPVTGEELGQFTIEDNGVGMNEHILLNYYLCAGASYRSSEEWKKLYTVNGRSQVARAGHFGVGFLAAFLLGDTVEVLTRHVEDELGYAFSFTNEATPLNVIREERPEGPGTTIKIKLKAGVLDKLKGEEYYEDTESDEEQWDEWCNYFCPWNNWYAFDEPAVQYFFNGKQMHYSGMSLSRSPALNPDWFCLQTNQYDAYLWKPHFSFVFDDKSNRFFCNGIRIERPGTHETLSGFGLGVPYPHVSLIDKEQRLEIDLPRKKVQTFPEKVLLAEQVLCYHIARLLMAGKNWADIECGFKLYRYHHIPFLLTADGFQLNNAAVLSVLNVESLLLLHHEGNDFSAAADAARSFLPQDYPCILSTDASAEQFVHNYLGAEDEMHLRSFADGYTPSYPCGDIWVRRDLSYDLEECPYLILRSEDTLSQTKLLYRYYNMEDDEIPPLPIQWENFDPIHFPIAIQILNPAAGGDTIFAEVLREILEPAPGYAPNDIWIPFDMEERKKKFPKAFRELKVFMDHIEKYGTE